MKSTVVIYKSKYGSTEKYAKWIAEDLKADIFRHGEVNVKKAAGYDIIIYCGGLYAGGMLGISFIRKNYALLRNKQLIIVAVGATTKREDAIEELRSQNLTPEMANSDNVQFFLLRGALNYKKMNLIDRFLMYMLLKSVKNKKPEDLDNDSKGVLATYGKNVDFTNKKFIEPILDAVREMNSAE